MTVAKPSRPGLLEGRVGIVVGVGMGLGRDVALSFAGGR